MVYKWYILPIGGLYNPYHLLGEPETAIDFQGVCFLIPKKKNLDPGPTRRKSQRSIQQYPVSLLVGYPKDSMIV